ncbi:hypothetical protein [Microbacterium sp. A84]|uniref:hypothetical protein n=1 Tax=Microbacterium sp. A84 TaxID=3450715 RepID=UPI003F43DE98
MTGIASPSIEITVLKTEYTSIGAGDAHSEWCPTIEHNIAAGTVRFMLQHTSQLSSHWPGIDELVPRGVMTTAHGWNNLLEDVAEHLSEGGSLRDFVLVPDAYEDGDALSDEADAYWEREGETLDSLMAGLKLPDGWTSHWSYALLKVTDVGGTEHQEWFEVSGDCGAESAFGSAEMWLAECIDAFELEADEALIA